MPIANSELSLTLSKLYQTEVLYGVDFSTALWIFDLYTEWAYQKSNRHGVFGISYELPYNENTDTAYFFLEHYYNGDGIENKDDYLEALALGTASFYNLGKQYLLAMISLPNPGSCNDISFSLTNLHNLNDKSSLIKFALGLTPVQDLQLDLGLSSYCGDSGSEFKLINLDYDMSLRVSVNF